jgi:hypothetical protein
MDRFKHTPKWLRGIHWEWVMNVMLLLIAVAIVLQTLYFRGANDQQKRCLQQQITNLTSALQDRQQPQDIERQATRTFIVGLIHNKDGQAGSEALIAQYEDELAKADRLRQDNPIPDYPNGVCGP